MFLILDRYLFRETFQAWLGVTGVLLLILLSSRFARYLGEAAAGKLPGEAVFSLLGLAVVNYLTILIPVGLLFAIMLALGRLYRDSEMVTMMSCGIGPREIYRPMFWLGGALALVLLGMALYVSPWAAGQSNIVRKNAERDAELSLFEAGRFKGSQDGSRVFYAERSANNGARLENVFIHAYEDEGATVVSAPRGGQVQNPDTGRRLLMLEDGYRYEGTPGRADYQIVQFGVHGIDLKPDAPDYRSSKRDLISTTQLLESDDPGDLAELQWRLSIPLMALVFTLLAVPLAKTSPRQGRYAKLVAAILIYVLYSNLLGISKVWLERGVLAPQIGLWWVPVLFTMAGLIMLAQQNGWLRRAARSGAA